MPLPQTLSSARPAPHPAGPSVITRKTSPAEARRRMRAMRKRVREHDVARWAADFLDTLNEAPGKHQWPPQ